MTARSVQNRRSRSICSSNRRAIAERHAQRREFDLVPADPHPEAKPPTGEEIDRGRLLGDQCRLPLGQDDDAGQEPQAGRDPREIGAEGERLVHRVLEGEGAVEVGMVGLVGPDHMVGDDEEVVAESLDRLGIGAQRAEIGADLVLGEDRPELHGIPFLIGRVTAARTAWRCR